MRIVHVYHSYYPVIGGMERALRRLAEEQTKMGHEVHVITSRAVTRESPAEEVMNGVYVHRVRAWKLHYPDLTVAREYIEELLREADVVHAHSQNSLFSVMVARRAKSLGAGVAIHFMAVDALANHPSIPVRTLGSLYGRMMTVYALRIADLKLSKSLRDVEILKSRYGTEDLHYVPDGVDRELLEMPSLEEEFRSRYGLRDNIVLFIGRLHPLKGVDVLLRAAPYVLEERRDVRFVFVGPGNAEPYVETARRSGVSDKVVFLGFVDERTKIGAIDSSTCLVLPSVCDYAEVYSLVISEAWARGKPVVASSVGEIPYRVKHMVNGILVPPRSPKALARAILMLLEDKTLTKELGLRGRRELKTWDEIARISLDLYRNITCQCRCATSKPLDQMWATEPVI